MKAKMNVGIIELSQKLLLDFLQYPKGKIRAVNIPTNRAGIIEIQIEHPEMPLAKEGYHVPVVTPRYITHQDVLGHKVTIREKS